MQELATSRILWFAFLVTQVVFAFVGTFLLPPPASAPEVTTMAAVSAAALPELGALVLAPRLFGHMPAASAWILKYALCEGIAMFGVAAHAIGAPSPLALGLHAVAIVALLTQFPTAERFTRWEVDRLGRSPQ